MPGRDDALSNVMIEILVALRREPMHGYAIKLDVEERIGGGYVMGSGSLYQALQRLERRGLITAAPELADEDRRRGRTYRIEAAGNDRLEAELARMGRVIEDARRARAEGDRAS